MKIIHAHRDLTPALKSYVRASLPAAFWREAKVEARERFLSPKPIASVVLARFRYYCRRYEILPYFPPDATLSLVVRRIPRRKAAPGWEFVSRTLLWPGNCVVAERRGIGEEATEAWEKLGLS